MANRPMATLMRTDRRIVIAQEGGLFHVRVEPAPDGPDMTGTFHTYRNARGHAGGLRLVHRWPVEDRTCSGEGLGK
ncbi:hypothetical protein [Sphingobium estronivorans]|uniref:hypothetical protein n=1 Tax=Sphingobium estronivorans TaxID=1577690 RepID=UPI001238A2FB|nr:hypothetical protein [Sphingobium estronivorans]